MALADADACAYDGAHHVAQKTIGGDVETVAFGGRHPFGLAHSADAGAVVAAGALEATEIVCTQQHPACPVHFIQVQRGMQQVATFVQKRVLMAMDQVGVAPLTRAEAGMSILRDREQMFGGDARRQHGVDALHEPVARRDGRYRVEMQEVGQSMHAGVRTAAAHGVHLVRLQAQTQRPLHFLLYRNRRRLPLPAPVWGAIVGEFHEIAGHVYGGTSERPEKSLTGSVRGVQK